MSIYVVIDPSQTRPSQTQVSVENAIREQDRCEVMRGVWFVRSDHATSGEVAASLEIDSKRLGIVVGATNFSGFAESKIVEKVSQWETKDA